MRTGGRPRVRDWQEVALAYRNKTYVCFDGDTDMSYYRLMQAWHQNLGGHPKPAISGRLKTGHSG